MAANYIAVAAFSALKNKWGGLQEFARTHSHERAIQFFMVWTNKLNAFFCYVPWWKSSARTCPALPSTAKSAPGPFWATKEEPHVCVIGRNLTWAAAASARFPGRRFHQVSRHEIRNRAAPETMGRNDNVAYVVIPCERARARESACQAIRMQPACLLCPTKSLPFFRLRRPVALSPSLSFGWFACCTHQSGTAGGATAA